MAQLAGKCFEHNQYTYVNTFLFAKQFPFIDIHIPTCMLSHFSCVLFFATQWTAAHQAPLSVGSSRQERWSGWPCPPPGDLPDPGVDLCLSCLLQAVSLPLVLPGKPICMRTFSQTPNLTQSTPWEVGMASFPTPKRDI